MPKYVQSESVAFDDKFNFLFDHLAFQVGEVRRNLGQAVEVAENNLDEILLFVQDRRES